MLDPPHEEEGPEPAPFNHRSPEDGCGLQPGATTLLFRSLPKHVTMSILLEQLDGVAPGKYDMVYLPCNSTNSSNIAMAVVNFVDHPSAKHAFEVFTEMANASRGEASTSALVRQARVQGLAPNLAFFVASAGLQAAASHPHAPRVFKNGVQISIMDAITTHVDMRILAEATKYTKPDKARKSNKKTSKTSSCSSSSQSSNYSSRHSSSSRSSCSNSSHGNSSHGYSNISRGHSSHGCTAANRHSATQPVSFNHVGAPSSNYVGNPIILQNGQPRQAPSPNMAYGMHASHRSTGSHHHVPSRYVESDFSSTARNSAAPGDGIQCNHSNGWNGSANIRNDAPETLSLYL
eukprot:TRINITY_DN13060_c0_g1_i1.p1 TRINITY_DN13060_c0_g1~~TRINITY_DN13060_c0_g1_i1.p1  ORF type:complete len:348 (-),score=43.02 TRINITY_DN13060_c0_g1_i1:138-1181(-)